MNLEKLIEQRSAVIEKLEAIKNVAMTETRAFTNEEMEKVEEYKEEVRRLDATIKALEETKEFKEPEKKEPEVRSLAKEIKGLDATKEIEVGDYEVRTKTHSIYKTGGTVENLSNVAKKTFADYILDKLVYISPLYAAIRKERFSSANHQIPVQANKLGKFVAMDELADYAKQSANFSPINLQAVKFGTMITFSEELIEDHGYDIESELLRQLTEAYGVSLDELVVKGGTAGGAAKDVAGLEKFNATADADGADGSKGVKFPVNGKVTIDHVFDMYYKLPIRYRANATWVISDVMAKALSTLKDANGMPLLTTSYNNAPFGSTHTLLGRPVIISEHVKGEFTADSKVMYFGDLSRALIVGERRSLKLTKSTEYGFIRDEIAIKASMRLDIKKGLGEAMVVGITKA